MPDLQRNGVRLHYNLLGSDGRLPLLLTHGFGASAEDWAPNAEVLAAKRPVITWDMRGHGRSDRDHCCNSDDLDHALHSVSG